MADYRAEKSGIAKQAQERMAAKWAPDRAKTAVAWVGATIGEPLDCGSGSIDEVYELFKNGLYMAKLANWVKPGIYKGKLDVPQKMAFKQMEQISVFLKSIEDMLKPTDLFQTVDLYEKVNLVQFITCLESLGRALNKQGRAGFGITESDGQAREWSDEQLKAGQNIIGLQMGSNKGASQAGQNFGKTRAIVD